MYICLKCTQFLKINAGNSLSVCYSISYSLHRGQETERKFNIKCYIPNILSSTQAQI